MFENIFGKSFVVHLHYSLWQVIGNTVKREQRPFRYGFCRRFTSTPDAWHWARYCDVDVHRNELLFNSEKKQKHLFRKMFSSSHTSNRIYLLRNCFSNYVYLKAMYITLKGIGNIHGCLHWKK